jgi:hypothetical protein
MRSPAAVPAKCVDAKSKGGQSADVVFYGISVSSNFATQTFTGAQLWEAVDAAITELFDSTAHFAKCEL